MAAMHSRGDALMYAADASQVGCFAGPTRGDPGTPQKRASLTKSGNENNLICLKETCGKCCFFKTLSKKKGI